MDLLKGLVGAAGLLVFASMFMYLIQGVGHPGGTGGASGVFVLLAFPGLEFLLGGLFVIIVLTIWWAWTRD